MIKIQWWGRPKELYKSIKKWLEIYNHKNIR